MKAAAGLSEAALRALERELADYAARLETAAEKAPQELAEAAADTARARLAPTKGTGELRASISVRETADGAEVTAGSDHAAFVEFGAGIGKSSGQRLDAEAEGEIGWQRDQKGRGLEGWRFPADDGSWPLTHGQSGRGFMAAGAEEARRRAAQAVRRHVG